MKGYVQVYTGDGKCKTTAAVGLIVRAAGSGLQVFFGQFLKGTPSGELRVLRERFPEVVARQFGRRSFVRGKPSPADVQAARAGLRELREALCCGRYDLVIADEANVAVTLGLLDLKDLLELVASRPPEVELVITGRGAHSRLIACADLVSEMKCRKHYFNRGVKSRKGIEC